MSDGFTIKIKAAKDCSGQIASHVSSMDALRERVEDIRMTSGEVSHSAREISAAIRAIAEKMESEEGSLKLLADKLDYIIHTYERTEQAILAESALDESPEGNGQNQESVLPDSVDGIGGLIRLLEGAGIITHDAGVLVSFLGWLQDLEEIASKTNFGALGNGMTIASLLVSIANDTLTNIKNGASINTILADIISEVGMTVGEWAIQTGCKAIGEAVGSAVPVVGTVIGGVIGDAVGWAAAETFDIVMKTDFDGDGATGFDAMSDGIENVLNDWWPDGSRPLMAAG